MAQKYRRIFWNKLQIFGEQAVAKIINVRHKYPEAPLADLYNQLTMPLDLRKTHAENNRAVLEAYDFSPNMSEEKSSPP